MTIKNQGSLTLFATQFFVGVLPLQIGTYRCKGIPLLIKIQYQSILSLHFYFYFQGIIWINGHNLGRYWPTVGPQVTLYVPGIWLKPAPEINVIQILELNKSPSNHTMKFIDHPILDKSGVGHKWID